MRFHMKSVLGKVAIAAVSLLIVFLLLRKNDVTVEYSQGSSYSLKQVLPSKLHSVVDLSESILFKIQTCVSSIRKLKITANFTMNEVLDNLVISYQPMGQAKEIRISGAVPENEPLQVIVIPHSHNDPGWKKTYRKYFDDQTTHIISNIVDKLYQYPDMTFVWVESCFLDMWWVNQTDEIKHKFRTLVESGRLEITSGMWVAPDEASPHYFALIDQMIEGHYWVKKNLGVVPESSLNFDQFGYSSTMPYLAKMAGLKNVLIKRIHRTVKELFGQRNQMNFHWRQFWDPHGRDDIYAHVDTYEWMSISDSCGPDRAVCRGLDFLNMPDLPEPGTSAADRPMRADHVSNLRARNFHEFAKNLVDQFNLKNANYKYRVMMLPHGGDFRFDTEKEWDSQYKNLKIFMNYVNENKDFNVKMRFGTLKDYFIEVDKQNVKYELEYPVISGDFYTYTENSEYWTGYFTTRQFDKRLGREVLESLRAAELMASILITSESINVDAHVKQEILANLVSARKELGIFQHHDAITGTSQAHVAENYEQLLSTAFVSLQMTLSTISEHLLTGAPSGFLAPALKRSAHDKLTQRVPISVQNKKTKLVLLNSLPQRRTELVTVTVISDKISITDPKGNLVHFDSRLNPSGAFDIRFIVDFPPLSLLTYTLQPVDKSDGVVKDSNKQPVNIDMSEKYVCDNGLMNVTFSKESGSPTQVCYRTSNFCSDVHLDWRYYAGYGGAYTMMSSGVDAPANRNIPNVKFLKDNVSCGIEVDNGYFGFAISLPMSKSVTGRAIRVDVLSDLTRTPGFVGDLAMRVETRIKSNKHFYVDSNGLQLMGRQFRENISFDGNVYPMSTMAMLEDDHHRLVVHSAQPHGVISRTSGVIDFMLDRLQTRPEMDMPEPVNDNKLTKTIFYIEVQSSSEYEKAHTKETALPSVNSMFLNDVLQHPIYKFFSLTHLDQKKNAVSYLRQPIPCDLVVANVKNLVFDDDNVYDGTSLTLFRRAVGCNGNIQENFCPVSDNVSVRPASLFGTGKTNGNKLVEMYLSHLMVKRSLNTEDSVAFESMDIKTFHIPPAK